MNPFNNIENPAKKAAAAITGSLFVIIILQLITIGKIDYLSSDIKKASRAEKNSPIVED